jgi:hypothetical protein
VSHMTPEKLVILIIINNKIISKLVKYKDYIVLDLL